MSADMSLRNDEDIFKIDNIFKIYFLRATQSIQPLLSLYQLIPPPAHPLCTIFTDVCVCVCSQGAAAYPENEDQQQRLREAAEGLRVATNAAAQNAIKKKLINRLEVSDAMFSAATSGS